MEVGEKATFVQMYEGLVATGLLAKLSGSAFKVLAALGLAATPLGAGTAANGSRTAARAFARDLVARGIVTPADHGRLFCCLPHHELARRTGLGKNTVTRATAELHALGLVEKRTVQKPDGTRYNIFFLNPASHLDKFNTHRAHLSSLQPPTSQPPACCVGEPKPHGAHSPSPPSLVSDSRAVLPETGTVPETETVPPPGTNYIQKNTTTPPSPSRETLDNNFDPLALLAHFAERQGLARYRPTAHDRLKLDRLRRRGYTQAQVLAAIDQAFDRRPADAPPIRMFSYCAAIALAGPPHPPVTATGTQRLAATASDSAIATEGPPLANNGATPAAHDPPAIPASRSPIPKPILELYQTEIGPLSPLICRELERLVAAYPQAAEWDAAFAEAVRANVRRLSYIEKVLEGRARRAAGHEAHGPVNHAPQGERNGKDRPHRGQSDSSRRDPRRRNSPRRGTLPFDAQAIIEGRQPFNWRTASEEEMRAVERAAAAVEPLDFREVLGVDHA